MKYDIERSLSEILKRGENLVTKKHKRAAACLGTLSAMTACLMAAVFYGAADFSGNGMISSSYGAFLLSREAGGYVLLAVIFFALGAGVSLGIMRFNRKCRSKDLMKASADDEGGGCL